MIGRLRGMLVSHRDTSVIIDVSGVGYEAQMTPRDLGSLPGVGEEIVVHTHTEGLEDDLRGGGGTTESERELFRILIGASGVGPKVGMAMLGSMSADEIVRAIVSEDAEALTVAPGVGKRGAQKIILELAPKLSGQEANITGAGDLVSFRSALEGLGYSTVEINAVVGTLNPSDPIEVQIKSALQTLGNR